MKKILLSCAIALSVLSGNSQTFTLTPGNVDTVDAPFNTMTIFDIYQNNISGTDILLKWTKVSVALPGTWDYSLCDLGHCYTGIPSSGTMDTVDAGDMGLLGLNINPYSTVGQGIVKLYVYDAAFPSNGDTVTWVVNASMVSVGEVNNTWTNVSVYPNPASNFVTLSNVSDDCTVQIFEATGKLVATTQLNKDNTTVDVSTYREASYIILISDNTGTIIRKRFIVKH